MGFGYLLEEQVSLGGGLSFKNPASEVASAFKGLPKQFQWMNKHVDQEVWLLRAGWLASLCPPT